MSAERPTDEDLDAEAHPTDATARETAWVDTTVVWSAVLLVALALWLAADGLVRLNTWYLASDQFAFLTFSRDLRRGTVFHEDPSWNLIAPPSRLSFDALAQTYFWRDGKLFSRYPPGFPALLAAAGTLFGEAGEHFLNPVLFLLTMVVLALTPAALLPGRRRLAAAVGATAVWLLLLLPSEIHLWGITVARDLPAHLLGLLAVLAAARRHFVLSGFLLGVTAVIRPDAVLYGVPIGVLALLERLHPGRALLATFGFLVGAMPLFLYNWVTLGNPLSFTQGGEFRNLLGAIGGRGVALAQTVALPSGGAFRLAHFPESFPGNLAHLGRAFGWMWLPGLIGLLWAWNRERRAVAALLPYAVVALLFYSFWSHADARYLAGVGLCIMPLVGLGLAVSAERVADAGRLWQWRLGAAVAALLAVVGALDLLPAGVPPPARPAWVSAVAIALVGITVSCVSRRRGAMHWPGFAVLVAPLSLAAVGLVAAWGAERRDPFQRPQVELARAAFTAVVPPGSLVITDTSLGRPAENITHYAGIRALYGSELSLLNVQPNRVVVQHKLAGKRVFYLLSAEDRFTLQTLERDIFRPRVVARRRGMELLDWFVNPYQAQRGAVLYEIDFEESWKRGLDDLVAKGLVPPYPAYRPPVDSSPSRSAP